MHLMVRVDYHLRINQMTKKIMTKKITDLSGRELDKEIVRKHFPEVPHVQ